MECWVQTDYFEQQDYNDYIAMPKCQRAALVLFRLDVVPVTVVFPSVSHLLALQSWAADCRVSRKWELVSQLRCLWRAQLEQEPAPHIFRRAKFMLRVGRPRRTHSAPADKEVCFLFLWAPETSSKSLAHIREPGHFTLLTWDSGLNF